MNARLRTRSHALTSRSVLHIEELEPRELLSTYHFDFGPIGSPVAPGYTGVGTVAYSQARGYGWASISGLAAKDQHTGNALTTDFVYGHEGTFEVDLPNGTYDVSFRLGDMQGIHSVALWAQGKPLARGLLTLAGQYLQPSFRVQVSTGQLSVHLTGIGGDTNFALDSLDINSGTGVFERMNWNQMLQRPTANIQNPLVSGVEIHLPWSMLEPSRGVFHWQMLDQFLATWGAAGKKVVFSVKTSPDGAEVNPYAASSTPQWVYAEGARSFQVTKDGILQELPVLWDPVFQKEYQAFVQQLAARYDGNPAIEYIIVGPGVFNSTRATYPGTIAAYQAAGYTDAKWYQANQQVMLSYLKAFHSTHLGLGMGPFITDGTPIDATSNEFNLARYAVAQGMYLDYHNLRGTSAYASSPYPAFFASLGASTKIALGTDNPTSGSAAMQQIYGDPATMVQYAFGGVNGLPRVNTYYLSFYLDDVDAMTPGSPGYQQAYYNALLLAVQDFQKNALAW